jgi:hypothetical protein
VRHTASPAWHPASHDLRLLTYPPAPNAVAHWTDVPLTIDSSADFDGKWQKEGIAGHPSMSLSAQRFYAFSFCRAECRAYANSADNITCIACGSAIALRHSSPSLATPHSGGR